MAPDADKTAPEGTIYNSRSQQCKFTTSTLVAELRSMLFLQIKTCV